MIYITNLFQVIHIAPPRASPRRHLNKFTSLTTPKNFLIKREDKIIQSHSESVNSERESQYSDLTLTEHNIDRTPQI